MSSYSPEQILDKFAELHNRYIGADRPVSIAKVSTFNVVEPFADQDETYSWQYFEVTPVPIVTDTPDLETWDYIGGSVGPDEKIFIFLADSLVARDPIATLGQRVEAFLKPLVGLRGGAIKYGDVLYSVKYFLPSQGIIGVIPQWTIVAKTVV